VPPGDPPPGRRPGEGPEGEGLNRPLARRVGSAMTWRAAQLGADQGISLLRFVILARLLAPEDFGLLAIATVVLELLMTVTNFGIVPALVQRPDPDADTYHAAWTVNLLRGLAVAAVIVLAAPLIAAGFGEPAATNVLRLLALRPLLSGLQSIRVADLERALDFRALGLLSVPATVAHTVVAIALAPLLGVYALIAGMLAAALVTTALSYRLAPYRPRLRFRLATARPLLQYGRWILATGLVGAAGEAALRAVVSRELGAPELGLYYLATRLVSLPNGVVSNVVGSVAFPLHARLQREPERAAAAFRANVTALASILVPVYALLVVLAPGLVNDVLGARWAGTVPVIRLLAVAAVLGVLADAVIPMLEGRGRPRNVTLLLAVRTVVLLAVAWPLVTTLGAAGAALAVVAAEVPTQLLAAVMAGRMLPRPFRGLLVPLLVVLVAAAAGAGTGVGLDLAISAAAGPVAAGAVGMAVAGGVLVLLDRVLHAGLLDQLLRTFPFLGRLLRRAA
jgi:O-antigen/teichoic acid export membrane protein